MTHNVKLRFFIFVHYMVYTTHWFRLYRLYCQL